MSAVAGIGCPECGEPARAGDVFCESCGAQLTQPRTPIPPPVNDRDHVVATPGPDVAGVSDRGRVHTRNEDAIALAVSDAATVLVVCDGVSTTADSDQASLAGAVAARDALAAGTDPVAPDAVRAAVRAAGDAVCALPGGYGAAPSCTIVVAVAAGPELTLAWLGDSRAYWLPTTGAARQLTADDSWAAAQIAAGTPREIAEAAPHAHAITAWLGADLPAPHPTITTEKIDEPGWLVVCSDGLWNYCSAPEDIAGLVVDLGADRPALELAEALVAWANDQGGRDNITVALARFRGPTTGGDEHVDPSVEAA